MLFIDIINKLEIRRWFPDEAIQRSCGGNLSSNKSNLIFLFQAKLQEIVSALTQ